MATKQIEFTKRMARLLLVTLSGLPLMVSAEPYFAVQAGYKCNACHVSPAGGGMRNAFGAVYGQTTLSRKRLTDPWLGKISDKFSMGGDFRTNALMRDIPGGDDNPVFETEEALVYAHFELVPNKLSFYADQRIGPGGSSNREAWAMYQFGKSKTYIRAGRMFLPFGWRLEDDSAFIRQVTGINYNTPDDGVEFGYESSKWSINMALTNGTAGGGDNDSGKQWSLRVGHVRPRWQLGGSVNINDVSGGSRQMYNVFAGFRTGKISWLGEIDFIDDAGFSPGPREQWLGLIEANWALAKGYNLKLTYEYLDPDDAIDEDDANRSSIVLEVFPVQFVQFSVGARIGDGIPQSTAFNTDEYFLQLHAYF